MIPRKLLILDLDETLIFAAERPLARAADFHIGPFHVYRRPGLTDFIDVCFELFDVAVWTSSSPLYAEEVAGAVFPVPSRLAFVWASDRCTRAYDPETGEHCAQKNLKKIKGRGYSLESVIAVDDSPEKWRQSYGNLVRVAPYHGVEEDTELSLLVVLSPFFGRAAGCSSHREEAVAAPRLGSQSGTMSLHMDLYPIHLNLQGRRCLLVGGGAVAARKAAGLLAAGADITLVSPEAAPALQALAQDGEIEWHREVYGTSHLDGVFLVMACTDDRAVNAAVTREAAARNLLVLCADDPSAGIFVSPAVVRRGDLLLTVSTGGAGPTLAAVLRERLEVEFGPEWAEIVAILGAMRESVKTNPGEAARKAAVRRVLDDAPVRDLLRAGKRLEAETRIRRCLSSSSE